MAGNANSDAVVVRGEFFSDGKKFVFRLADTPLSGVGDTASAAFDDLMRIEAQTAPLSDILRDHARDQEGERVRASIVRTAMAALIVFAVLGGAIVATAALLPQVISDVGGLALTRLADSIDTMSPERQAKLSRVAKRINALLGHEDAGPGCDTKPVVPAL